MASNKAVEIAEFLGNSSALPCLHITEEETEVLDSIDSRGSYDIARIYVKSVPTDRQEHLLGLINITWDALCLEDAYKMSTFSAPELRQMFNDAPSGLMAQQHIIKLFRELKEFT